MKRIAFLLLLCSCILNLRAQNDFKAYHQYTIKELGHTYQMGHVIRSNFEITKDGTGKLYYERPDTPKDEMTSLEPVNMVIRVSDLHGGFLEDIEVPYNDLDIDLSGFYIHYLGQRNFLVFTLGRYQFCILDLTTSKIIGPIRPEIEGEASDSQDGTLSFREVLHNGQYLSGYAENFGKFCYNLRDLKNPVQMDQNCSPTELELEELVSETVSMENIPGMIAAILDSTGIRYIGSAGMRKMGSTEPITNKDIFHLGSCTKAMTAVLLANLIDKNEINWETTIIDVFPELKDSIHPDYHQITLHQLLTHRAGLARDGSFALTYETTEIKQRRIIYMLDALGKPGQHVKGEFLYSNLGYTIAGILAERITGESWEDLMEERLFDPLAMKSAGIGPPGTQNLTDQPWGHNKFAGIWMPRQLDNPVEMGPAGRVHSSIEDWGKFISLFLKEGENNVVTPLQIDRLTQAIGSYACGWFVANRGWARGMALNHNGSNTMWYASVWIAPEINRAFIVGTNSSDVNTARICDEFIGKLIRIDVESHD